MSEILDFVQRHPMLVGGFTVLCFMTIWAEVERFTKKFKDLSPQDAVRLINEEAPLILDVREHNELSNGIIKGAKHVPMSAIKTRLSEFDPRKYDTVVAYCRSGNRSSSACRMLTSHGFENVYNLAGGMMAWESANLPKSKK